MSIELQEAGKGNAWTFNGKAIDVVVRLFYWKPEDFINLKTKKKSKRLVWTISGMTISTYQQAKSGGSILKEPPEYIIKQVKKTERNISGFRKERIRINVDGCTMVAYKLSHICYGQNDMSLPIRPSKLHEMVEDAIKNGQVTETPHSYRLILIRSNDLKREPKPSPNDRWVILRTVSTDVINSMLPDINDIERKIGSDWRLAPNDPRLESILRDV